MNSVISMNRQVLLMIYVIVDYLNFEFIGGCMLWSGERFLIGKVGASVGIRERWRYRRGGNGSWRAGGFTQFTDAIQGADTIPLNMLTWCFPWILHPSHPSIFSQDFPLFFSYTQSISDLQRLISSFCCLSFPNHHCRVILSSQNPRHYFSCSNF